jgi:putative tryptophan/tyrosine transport system substrate-binding protein
MTRKAMVVWLVGLALAPFRLAAAQQPKKVPQIGFLSSSSPSAVSARLEAFRQGLRELGYVEGKNIIIEYRFAEGMLERLPDLTAELVSLKVQVIVALANTGAVAAKHATQAIPIVIEAVGDPVATGLVASLARPGGNITGLSTLSPELSGKRLELLKEVLPTASRVAILWNPTQPSNPLQLKEVQAAAQAFALRIQSLEVSKSDDLERAFTTMAHDQADAFLFSVDPLFLTHRVRLTNLASKHRLPGIYAAAEYVEAGGLMSYAPDYSYMFRRAATYVDKILKGAKPADLPVEQPTKFEFIINLKAAKQIGLTIPPNVLARADKVIK